MEFMETTTSATTATSIHQSPLHQPPPARMEKALAFIKETLHLSTDADLAHAPTETVARLVVNYGEEVQLATRCLLVRGWQPAWLKLVSRSFTYQAIPAYEARALGFREIAGPYQEDEYWMLERAIADSERNGTPWVLTFKAGALRLWRRKARKTVTTNTHKKKSLWYQSQP